MKRPSFLFLLAYVILSNSCNKKTTYPEQTIPTPTANELLTGGTWEIMATGNYDVNGNDSSYQDLTDKLDDCVRDDKTYFYHTGTVYLQYDIKRCYPTQPFVDSSYKWELTDSNATLKKYRPGETLYFNIKKLTDSLLTLTYWDTSNGRKRLYVDTYLNRR